MKKSLKRFELPISIISFGLLAIFILFCLVYIAFVKVIPKPLQDINWDAGSNSSITEELTGDVTFDEVFKYPGSIIKSISVRTVTWGRAYPANYFLNVQLIDDATGNKLYDGKVPMSSLLDNGLSTLINSTIKVSPDSKLRLRIIAPFNSNEQSFCLMRSQIPSFEQAYAEVNGVRLDSSFSIHILGF